MAAEVLKSITEFKNCIEVFLTQNTNEEEKTDLLHNSKYYMLNI